MMDYVGLMKRLDAIKIFLDQSLVVHHWKEMVSKSNEKTKAMAAQLKDLRVEVSKTKQLGMELAKSRETMRKLIKDLDNHVVYLSSKSEENKALNGRVADLEQQVKDICMKMRELTSEKKMVKEDMRTTKNEIFDLMKMLTKMENELQKKKKVKSALMVELDEAKRLIALHHRKGFKKAQC
ncbi:hypothetical protein GmHk_11G032398 [Glycine max]|nr:hypothetical protein GmHk_11G032398 [Glycine max]